MTMIASSAPYGNPWEAAVSRIIYEQPFRARQKHVAAAATKREAALNRDEPPKSIKWLASSGEWDSGEQYYRLGGWVKVIAGNNQVIWTRTP
jgi:hypothetical protein